MPPAHSEVVEREAEPDRAGQVGGDRRRGRDDVQLWVTEHLVPPARDRLCRRRDHAAHDVAYRIHATDLRAHRAGAVERSGPVVKQSRVIRAGRRRQRRVPLVTGGPDRMEALAEPPQPASRQVEVTARQLRFEKLQCEPTVECPTLTQRRA
jgi:hypothetical protein